MQNESGGSFRLENINQNAPKFLSNKHVNNDV